MKIALGEVTDSLLIDKLKDLSPAEVIVLFEIANFDVQFAKKGQFFSKLLRHLLLPHSRFNSPFSATEDQRRQRYADALCRKSYCRKLCLSEG